MIWLASFPRSGNTFCRNLFYDVYGLESTSFPIERNSDKSKKYRILKTHVPYENAVGLKDDDLVICLVRDGRDAITSNAKYRKNFIEPRSKLKSNIDHGIVSPRGAHFGGWSKNVNSWIERADLIIRFEELIKDPLHFLKKIEAKTDLPEADYSKIKTFSQLKYGAPRYGSGGQKTKGSTHSKKFFNKGKVGQWKEVFSGKQHKLFWLFHGEQMKMMGYGKDGDILPVDFTKTSFDHSPSDRLKWLKKYHEARVLLNSAFQKTLRVLKLT
ncbi:sulfotransferase domain-containing protein [Owenweeksia hongkongensis]|uniref:sulfotransferase domain-containing protein n=1 Tax=Owenweeksia hongkongensis TaxID=253245 RepID=UPI003A8DC18B